MTVGLVSALTSLDPAGLTPPPRLPLTISGLQDPLYTRKLVDEDLTTRKSGRSQYPKETDRETGFFFLRSAYDWTMAVAVPFCFGFCCFFPHTAPNSALLAFVLFEAFFPYVWCWRQGFQGGM